MSVVSAATIAGAAGALTGLALAEGWAALEPSAGNAGPWRAAGQSSASRARRGNGGAALAVLAVVAVGWSLGGAVGGALAGVTVVAVLRQATSMRARRGARTRERGVGPLARSIADAIRGGRSIRGALRAAAADRSVPGALREVVLGVDVALARGGSLTACLEDLGRRGGPQLTLLAAVVALHAERGGALARELDALAQDADRAVLLDEERASATAQARATVRTVAALPLLALAAAQLLGGDFLAAVARHPAALALLLTGLVLEAVAVIVTRRLVVRAA